MNTCYILLLENKPILKYAQGKDTFNGCCSVCISTPMFCVIVFYQFVKRATERAFYET